ncbi:hypothetical protein TNCV_3057751 [Trichonephila clavipes]|nr:hypothetical protein TNCV_3057751 [Trichonephila clavipes]
MPWFRVIVPLKARRVQGMIHVKFIVYHPSGIVVCDADSCAVGPGRRAASHLMRLVEGEDRWKASDFPPGGSTSKLTWNRAKPYCHVVGAQSYG